MPYSITVREDLLRTANFSAISGTYVALGIAFAHRMRMVKIANNTDGDMFIAVTSGNTPASDGTADNDFIAAGSFALYDFTSNSEASGSPFCFQEGTQFWVRQSTAPTKKDIWLTAIYGKGE